MTPQDLGHANAAELLLDSLLEDLRRRSSDEEADEAIDAIETIFHFEEYACLASGEQLKDSIALLERLDQVLNDLKADSPAWNKGLDALQNLSAAVGKIPSSVLISEGLERTGNLAKSYGVYADVWGGLYGGARVAIKALRVYDQDEVQTLTKLLCKECVAWKFIKHPSILPFYGVSTTIGVSLVSPWMSSGNIHNYIKKQPDVDRVTLVDIHVHVRIEANN